MAFLLALGMVTLPSRIPLRILMWGACFFGFLCIPSVAFQTRPTHLSAAGFFLQSQQSKTSTRLNAFFPNPIDLKNRIPLLTRGDDNDNETQQRDKISRFLITSDREELRSSMEEWEEEDFLLADVRPKELNHERDFFRVATRVQAWDEYVIVSILCTSICFSTLLNFPLNPDHIGIFFYETILRTALQVVAGGAVLCGIYSTMVFSISILYGKTALGLEQDPQFDNFLDNTLEIRKRAFLSFSYSLGLFAIMVVLLLAEILPLYQKLPLGAIGLGVVPIALFFRDWTVLTAAAEEVFDDE